MTGGGATALAAALIAGELTCGIWFLACPQSKAPAPVWVCTGISVVWTVLAAQACARGLVVADSGCFGTHLTQRPSWLVLLQDALTLQRRTADPLRPHGTRPFAYRPGGGARRCPHPVSVPVSVAWRRPWVQGW